MSMSACSRRSLLVSLTSDHADMSIDDSPVDRSVSTPVPATSTTTSEPPTADVSDTEAQSKSPAAQFAHTDGQQNGFSPSHSTEQSDENGKRSIDALATPSLSYSGDTSTVETHSKVNPLVLNMHLFI